MYRQSPSRPPLPCPDAQVSQESRSDNVKQSRESHMSQSLSHGRGRFFFLFVLSVSLSPSSSFFFFSLYPLFCSPFTPSLLTLSSLLHSSKQLLPLHPSLFYLLPFLPSSLNLNLTPPKPPTVSHSDSYHKKNSSDLNFSSP